jgi:hypothetical protein
MARLWSFGAELQSAAAGIEIDTVTGTAPTISTTTVRSGAAALRFNPSAATSFVTHRFAPNAIRNQFVRFAFRFATLPAADVDLFQWYDGTNGFPSIRYIAASTALRCRDGTPAVIGSLSSAITTGVWYVVRMQYNDTTGNVVNAFLDSTQFATAAVGGDVGGLGQVRFGLIQSATADLFIDDFAVNDDTGTAESSYPDQFGKYVHLNVNAAGDSNDWATAVGGTAGTANNFTRVAETPSDELTTYNQTSVTGTTLADYFNMQNGSVPGIGSSDTIKFVGVGARIGSSTTTAANLVLGLRRAAAATPVLSGALNVNVNGFRTGGVAAAGDPQPSLNIIAYVDPTTTVAWTATQLDSIQVGYKQSTAQTSVRRVTKVWAGVEYVPSSTTPVTGSVDLRWAVRSTVTASVDLRWRVANVVTGALDVRWAVASSVSSAVDLRWAVLAGISGGVDLRWRVANVVTAALNARWAVANVVTGSTDLRWAVRATVTGAVDLRWGVTAPVAAALDVRWRVSNLVSGSLDLRWALAAPITSALDVRWRVWSVVSGALDARWTVSQAVTTGMDLRWAIRSSVVAPLDLRWSVLAAVQAALDVRWALRAEVSGSLDLRWAAFAVVTAPLDLRWVANGRPAGVLDLRWAVRGVVTGTLDLRWGVRLGISAPLDVRWQVLHRVSVPLELLWVSLGAPDLGEPKIADVIARLTARLAVVPVQLLQTSRPAQLRVIDPELIRYWNGPHVGVELTEEP